MTIILGLAITALTLGAALFIFFQRPLILSLFEKLNYHTKRIAVIVLAFFEIVKRIATSTPSIHFAHITSWVFWKYIGFISLMVAMPLWPWVIFLFMNNDRNVDGGLFLLDWSAKPTTHFQKLMYAPVDNLRSVFEFGVECMCRDS